MTWAAAGNRIALPVTLLLATALAQGPPEIGGCPVLPADNIWNTPVDGLPVDANSAAYVATIGAGAEMHPDFGSGLWDGGPIGIPFVVVPGSQPRLPVSFLYHDESDAGGYAVPLDAPIEEGSQSDGDRHAIALDRDNCILYTTNSNHHLLSRRFQCGLFSKLSNGGLPGSKDCCEHFPPHPHRAPLGFPFGTGRRIQQEPAQVAHPLAVPVGGLLQTLGQLLYRGTVVDTGQSVRIPFIGFFVRLAPAGANRHPTPHHPPP